MSEGDWLCFYGEEKIIRLLERPRVYLLRTRQQELENRLAEIFRYVWGMIPPGATERIAQYWQPIAACCHPHIVIKELGAEYIGRAILGNTEINGRRIEFDRHAVARFPDRQLIGLVLHELAHVYGHATGEKTHKYEYASFEDREKTEEPAKDILRSWGLSEYDEEVDNWIESHPEWDMEKSDAS